MKDLIDLLCEAPEGQIDPCIVDKLKALDPNDIEMVARELKTILDECARYSLASDFAMTSMDMLYQVAVNKKYLTLG